MQPQPPEALRREQEERGREVPEGRWRAAHRGFDGGAIIVGGPRFDGIEHARQLEQATRENRARALRVERSRAERLVAEVQSWRRSAEIDDYVRELRKRLPALPGEERERVSTWADWAAGWAAGSDPVRHTQLILGLDEDASAFA